MGPEEIKRSRLNDNHQGLTDNKITSGTKKIANNFRDHIQMNDDLCLPVRPIRPALGVGLETYKMNDMEQI